jgi:outer membrane biosynthesis protein TonB
VTERQALLGAGAAHILLFAALSIGWQLQPKPLDVADEMIPVEFVDIADAARVAEKPKPSMEAAPQESNAPEPAEAKPAEPAPPVPEDAVPPPEIKPEPKPGPPKKAQAKTVEAKPLDMSSLSNLIDKALPKAKSKPLDTSKLATSIEAATPKAATIDPRTAATLKEAIRAQIFLCWNPPIGGADVREMTVVLRADYAKDGTIIGLPKLVSQTGATAGNADYARVFADTARRAMLKCSPIKLPPKLYDFWKTIELNFDPRTLT